MIHALTNRCELWYQTLHSWLQSDIRSYWKLGAHLYPVLFRAVCTHRSPVSVVSLWYDASYVTHMWKLHPVALKQWATRNPKQYFLDRVRFFIQHCRWNDTYVGGVQCYFLIGEPYTMHINWKNWVLVYWCCPQYDTPIHNAPFDQYNTAEIVDNKTASKTYCTINLVPFTYITGWRLKTKQKTKQKTNKKPRNICLRLYW